VRPDHAATFAAEDNIIAGNVIGYGATSGHVFIRGVVGERFAVRNSGATLVVEGVGDHACEYMTGGRVVILGPTGRNLAAGMSGGVAYVLDLDVNRVNPELVDLEPLSEEHEVIVRELLARHRDETGSEVARHLLEDDALARFTVVMPRDYRRALEAQRRAALEGRDPAEAVMEASRG
jgi:glutamate synthase (NADPH/NADH) large chain